MHRIRIKYPKFILLILTIILAYLLFHIFSTEKTSSIISSFGYFGTFITGILFSYGFLAAPSTAVFLILAEKQNILVASLIGGLGSMIGNLLIFHIIRTSFSNEIKKLEREKITLEIESFIPPKIRRHLLSAIAGFVIASPLPDELGVSLFAMHKKTSIKLFSIISFILHSLGILAIFLIGKVI